MMNRRQFISQLVYSNKQNPKRVHVFIPKYNYFCLLFCSHRREKSFQIASYVIRTVGSLMCIICAGILMERTTSDFNYLYPVANESRAIYDTWRESRDKATWISTAGLGLGLGAVAGSGLHVNQPRGFYFYLATLLGQLIVPASAGYLTERVFHKDASETLGRTTLILSILLFFCLLLDLLLLLVRRFVWWNKFTRWLSPIPEIPSKMSPQNKPSSSTSRSNSVVPDDSVPGKNRPSRVVWMQSPSDIPLETRSLNSNP